MCVLCGNLMGCGTGVERRKASAAVATSRMSTTAPTTYLRIDSCKGKRGSLSRFELECLGSGDHFLVVFGRNRLRCVGEVPHVSLEPRHLRVHLVQLMSGLEPGVPLARRRMQLGGHAE